MVAGPFETRYLVERTIGGERARASGPFETRYLGERTIGGEW